MMEWRDEQKQGRNWNGKKNRRSGFSTAYSAPVYPIFPNMKRSKHIRAKEEKENSRFAHQ